MSQALRALLLVCLLLGIAHADKQAAEKYFQAGSKAYAAQNFAAAAANFDEAFKELAMPEIAFSAAQAYRRLYRVDPKPGHVKRAVELYRIYLEKVKTGGRVGDASDNLGEMERELDKIEAKSGKVRIDVTERTRLGVNISIATGDTPVGPPIGNALREIGEGTGSALPGVKATLDGKPIEPFALTEVEPGDHTVTVTADGYFPVEKKQRAVKGATSLVEIDLRPKPAKVTIKTETGAKVLVDGRPAAGTTLDLGAGKHLLTVLRDGRQPFGREVSVTRGQQLSVDAPLEKTGRRRAVPWVLGGAAGFTVLSAITGLVAVVADNSAEDRRAEIALGNATPGVGDEYDRQVRRRDTFKTASIVFGTGALITGAIGFGLYFFDSPSASKLETRLGSITPVIGPGTAGVATTRRF